MRMPALRGIHDSVRNRKAWPACAPSCGYRCNACLGTGTVISRERLKALKDTDWFTPQFDSPVSDEEDMA